MFQQEGKRRMNAAFIAVSFITLKHLFFKPMHITRNSCIDHFHVISSNLKSRESFYSCSKVYKSVTILEQH